ncbi:MAG TPA: hypothetical protein VF311_10365, partial [Terriglobales bacterium]
LSAPHLYHLTLPAFLALIHENCLRHRAARLQGLRGHDLTVLLQDLDRFGGEVHLRIPMNSATGSEVYPAVIPR